MALIDRVRAYITDLLPSGDFWRSAAAQRFVNGLSGAVLPLAAFADSLRDEIFPGTAGRPVLLQWWEFIRITCAATPADTEDLREAVVSAISSPPGHTIAGLRQLVAGQGLRFVELDHLLPISNVPFLVPSPIDPHARILEVWNSPLLHNVELVRCIVREFAQAADLLRIISPESYWVEVGAFFWANCPGSIANFERREDLNDVVVETASVVLDDETGAIEAVPDIFAAYNTTDAVSWEITRVLDGETVIHEVGLFATPVSNPILPVAVTSGSTVPCGGDTSTNADVYQWSILGYPEIEIPDGELSSFIAPDVDPPAELLIVQLTVSNDSGATDTATANIVIVPA